MLNRLEFCGVKNGVALKPAWILGRNHILHHWKNAKRLQNVSFAPD
jgi:hypothetical protein